MATSHPLRGEVWDIRFPSFGEHPAVIVSVNSVARELGHISVIPVTGTTGPEVTHVPLGKDAGLTRYDESYADVTAVQPVARSRAVRRRRLLAPGEIARIEDRLRIYLGL